MEIAICRLIIKNQRFYGDSVNIGVCLSGKDKVEALGKLDTDLYEFIEWNDTYTGEPLMVKA